MARATGWSTPQATSTTTATLPRWPRASPPTPRRSPGSSRSPKGALGHAAEPLGHDSPMTTEERERYAGRAALAYRAMLRRFRRRSLMYRYDEGPTLLRSGAQL